MKTRPCLKRVGGVDQVGGKGMGLTLDFCFQLLVIRELKKTGQL